MAPAELEKEDHDRDAAFNNVLHGQSSGARGGLAAMRSKDAKAQEVAVEEYFKHWDKKDAADETDETREVGQNKRTGFSWSINEELTNWPFCEARRGELNMPP